jgi:hypothetical protein
VFDGHSVRRDARYIYSKGEPTYASKPKDYVAILQRSMKIFMNSNLVDREGKVPRLSSEEDVPLFTDDERFRCRETCRHDFPLILSQRELRYEVYLRFIDKFCRDQGTVMLVFAGAKAVSACSVISLALSIPSINDSSDDYN